MTTSNQTIKKVYLARIITCVIVLIIALLFTIFFKAGLSKNYLTILIMTGTAIVIIFGVLITIWEPKKVWAKIYDYIGFILTAVSVVALIFNYVFAVARVDGNSMETTLSTHDILIISHLTYSPKKNDVIIIKAPGVKLIKRVAAISGDEVSFNENNQLVVNQIIYHEDLKIHDSNARGNILRNVINGKLLEDQFIFIGDNHNLVNQGDSRCYGSLSYDDIIGKVIFRISKKFGVVQ